MKIRIRKFLLLFIILIVSIGAIVFCGSSCYDLLYFTITDVAYLLTKWNVELPDDSKLILYKEHAGFTGDGERFCIVGFEEEPAELLKDFSYKLNKSDQEYLDYIIGRLTNNDEQVDYSPDWEANYLYSGKLENGGDDLYMWYYPENLELYIVMSLL